MILENNSCPSIKVLVIGSGLASYGTCLGLIDKKGVVIDVFDVGLTRAYNNQPNKVIPNSKDLNGSFYPYGLNDERWDMRIKSKRLCSSHAFGGFSKAYSGSILQPKIEDMTGWPKASIPEPESIILIE